MVGLLAAVLQGAPLTTFDLDIVHRRTDANVTRLLAALEAMNAVYRTDARALRPTAAHLLGPGHHLLRTDLGDLDCLGEIDDGATFDELVSDSVALELGEGLACRAISIAKLVEIKRRLGRPKDLAAIPMLEATLEELRKRSGDR